MPDDSLHFHRSGATHPMGKCAFEAKTVLPQRMGEDLIALARMKDKSLGEYLRGVIEKHLYGEFLSAQMKVSGAVPRTEGRE